MLSFVQYIPLLHYGCYNIMNVGFIKDLFLLGISFIGVMLY